MLETYPTWRMNVYPTRRSAAFPEGHYEQTMANATRATMRPDGLTFEGTTGGIPFPIPQSGEEAIWNHLVRYRGESYVMNWSQAAVTRTGSYTPVRFDYEYDFHYGSLTKSEEEIEPEKIANFMQTVTAPARLAGQILLVHEYLDERQAWTYNPGQRRVRLAPQVQYDNPGTASDGLRTNDDFVMFNGAIDRYDWDWSASARSTCPTTPTNWSATPSAWTMSSRPGTSIPITRATSCTASGSWTRH